MINGQDMNLAELVEQFSSEDRCRAYLEALRWPQGVRCPRCGFAKISRVKARKGRGRKADESRSQFDCDSCRYQFSVTSGTVFHDTHLSLRKWFMATYLICESRKGISGRQMQRTLGVANKTAWYLCHRIRSAMKQAEEPLRGIVEADETYLGGRIKHGKGKHSHQRKDWRQNKSIVLGAIERGGNLRLRHVPNARKGNVHKFLDDVVHADAQAIYTDSFRSYPAYKGFDANTRHEYVNHEAEEWVRGDVHTNNIESAWSLFDRAMIGAYHQLSKKHLPAYLDEFTFRFNNRENPYLFRDTLIRLLSAETLPYSELVDPSSKGN